jgi:hypothetical protein
MQCPTNTNNRKNDTTYRESDDEQNAECDPLIGPFSRHLVFLADEIGLAMSTIGIAAGASVVSFSILSASSRRIIPREHGRKTSRGRGG